MHIPKTFSCLLAIFMLTGLGRLFAEEREWTDKTGKFKVTAEYVGVENGKVLLRTSNNRKLRVPLEKLSAADKKVVATLSDGTDERGLKLDEKQAKKEISSVALDFYRALRETDRSDAIEKMTTKAKRVATDPKSPFKTLPRPAPGSKSIALSRAQIDGDVAEIPVRVKSGGIFHRTKLHLRYEDELWQVFAMSAKYPEGEKSINFEAEILKKAAGISLAGMMGKPISMTGYTVDDKKFQLDEYRGKIVLVDFWATWCGPCLAEIPNVRQNYEKYHKHGFDVVAISLDRDTKKLAQFVGEEKPPWTVVADYHPSNKERMGAKYGIRGIPSFALIDRDGKVASVNCRGSRLGPEIARLLKKSPNSKYTGSINGNIGAQLD